MLRTRRRVVKLPAAPHAAPPHAAHAAPANDRKADHLRIAAGHGVAHRSDTGLDAIRLRHRALPERNLEDVSLETRLLGARLQAPLVISAMTGGTPEAAEVNRALIDAAAARGLALCLGSGRRLLDDPSLLPTYRPVAGARPPLLLANLGAVQLTVPDGPQRARRLVELLGADGLSVHLNPLQEAVQPEGDGRFEGVLAAVRATADALAPLPVVVKEVGFGMSAHDVSLLAGAGIAAIDVAGSGGTNWALIEGERDAFAHEIAAAFSDWGQSTVQALGATRHAGFDGAVIASGGLWNGVDCAKCLALGADACGMARPLLLAARAGRVDRTLDVVLRQLRIATWLAGAARTAELDRGHLQ